MDKSSLLLFSLFFGIFSLMALSNAIIPILPVLDGALHMQTSIYAAYFFGAMVTTLPAGIISDRVGQIPVILSGLVLTILAGILLMITSDPVSILLVRIFEGVGAGLFVAASLSWINYQQNQARLSGIFMALLNFGLLGGLIAGGWITGYLELLSAGIPVYTVLSNIPLVLVLVVLSLQKSDKTNPGLLSQSPGVGWKELFHAVKGMLIRQAPLWYSVIILLGITGFVQAVYPEISDLSATDIGISLAFMNLATIIASLTAPWFKIEPVLLIRISAFIMGGLVLLFAQFPLVVFIMGFLAGLIMISQIRYLALAEQHQGIAMGLFSTSSYAGMTILPAVGGFIAGQTSMAYAEISIMILAMLCVVIIGKCSCRGFSPDEAA